MTVSSPPAILRLDSPDNDTQGLPGLVVADANSPTPDYSTALYRLYWAEHGDTSLILDEQNILLPKGHLLTLSPGESLVLDQTAPLRSLAFHHNFVCVRVLRDEVFCDGVVFNRLRGLPIVAFPEEEQSLMAHRFNELTSLLSQQGHFTHERALSTVRNLLLHAADFKLRTDHTSNTTHTNAQRLSSLVRAFKELVEQTYSQHKHAAYYSDNLGVSTITLNRKVKEELGQSVMQVISERLAIAARAELRSGNKSIKEVSFALGFDDPLYFSRFFKKHFGRPPSHYFRDL